MNSKIYFDEALEKLINMSEEEFEQLLIEAGIEDCFYEDEYDRYYWTGI